MKVICTPLLVLLLSGCAQTGPVADGTTTFTGLASGAQEANPIIAANPNAMVPLSIAARVGVMRHVRGADNCTEVAGAVDSFGWGAAANNIAAMAGAGPAAIPIGLIATLVLYDQRRDHFSDYCRMPCSLSDLPGSITKARCERGRIVMLSDR